MEKPPTSRGEGLRPSPLKPLTPQSPFKEKIKTAQANTREREEKRNSKAAHENTGRKLLLSYQHDTHRSSRHFKYTGFEKRPYFAFDIC